MKAKWFALLLSFILALASSAAVLAATAEGAQTWEVSVGQETNDGVSIDSMFPSVVYVHEGDTVKFTNGAQFTPHTVTFLAGADVLTSQDPSATIPAQDRSPKWDGKSLLNSGIMEPGQNYEITFESVGVFPYYCILHPMMRGTVVVVPKDAPIPSKEEQAVTAQMALGDLIAQAETLKMAHHQAAHTQNDDGKVTYSIALGAGHNGFSVNKMMPETVFVSVGDTMEWVNENNYEPHWVTFNKPDDLSFFGEHGEFNPAFMAPSGGPTFDGTGFTNSGIVVPGQSYQLTFTQPGIYPYVCYLHSGSQMFGTIVVAPSDAVKVTVNDQPLTFDYNKYQAAHLDNNQVYAPVVPFFEALGAKVTWDTELRAVVVDIGGQHALPGALNKVEGIPFIINGKQVAYTQGQAPHLHNDHTYASLQEMVSLLGGAFSWDEVSQTFDVHVN